ncbi:MAG: tetratricopeptide repeat protein [bacterium]|nr:tetratricopeptide repeat protein [bacterium]
MRKPHRRAHRAAREAGIGPVLVPHDDAELPIAARPPATALAALLIVVAAGVVAYSNTFSAPFFFDDLTSIVQNPSIRRFHPLSQVLAAPTQTSVAGRPVVNLSLAVNYAIGGFDVRGYHVFNLTVHLMCSLVLFGVVRRTLQQATFGGRFDDEASWLSVAVTALWSLHPLLTESVTYVTQRTELLMALFYLLTLYSVIRGWCSQRRWAWYVCAVVCCALGMASKEVMVSAPLIVLLYDRTFVSGSFRRSLRRHAGLYVGLAGTWVILALLMGSSARGDSVGFGLGVSALDYLRTQSEVIVWYLRLSFWPDPLAVSYEWRLAQTFADCMPHGLIVVALLLGTLWAWWRRPALGFVGACFFLILAPTSSVVPIVTEIAGERRMYLPLACVVVLFVVGGHHLLQGVGRRLALQSVLPRLSLGVLVTVLVAGLGFHTFRRNNDYRSVLSIWTDTVANRPLNYRAHSNLAGALIDADRLEEAVVHCTLALQLRPDHMRARANLALVRKRQGRLDEAIDHYNEALTHRPRNSGLHHNLAIALVAQGDLDAAIGHFIAALRIQPELPLTHLNLAEALVAQGRTTEAEIHYRETLRLRPALAPAHCNFGNMLFGRGKIEEATEHFLAAVRIDPGFADARANLAVALARQGETREAIKQYHEALRIDPNHVQARRGLDTLQATHLAPEGP